MCNFFISKLIAGINVGFKIGLVGIAILFLASPAFSHEINYALEKVPRHEVAWFYIVLGFKHIVPEGFDHILFIVSLCLLSTRFKPIFWQATAFTVAHSITLALSMKSIFVVSSAIVEPIISLSIMFVAIENCLFQKLHPGRILVVFFFGLIHGMGFASALNQTGLPRNNFFTSILSFNAGVELGQIAVILLVFGLLIIPFRKNKNYRKWIVYPVSILIALIAFYWTIQRVFFT